MKAGKSLMLFLCGLFVVCSPAFGASAPGMITDLRLSPDCKRLIIRSKGTVSGPTVTKETRASRLVIDFQTAGPGKLPRLMEFRDRPVREIRIGRFKAGTRIVVDFGDHGVPDYRIRRIDDYFMLFLGEYRRAPAVNRGPRRADGHARKVPKPTVIWDPVQATTGNENLIVRSAKAHDGHIVVEAAERTNPGTTYRINLLLDTRLRRVSAAEISVIPPSNAKRSAQQTARPTRLSVKGAHGPVRDQRSAATEPRGLSVQRGPTRPGEALDHANGSPQGLFMENSTLTAAGRTFNPQESH